MSSKRIKTIILDLDGPLLDGIDRHYHCYRDILKAHGFASIPIGTYWKMKRNRDDGKKLLALSNAAELYDDFLSSWINRIETKEYLVLDRLQNQVLDILKIWKCLGIRLFLVTMRNNPANLKWQLECLGLNRFFDEVITVGSQNDGNTKSSRLRPFLKDVTIGEVIWIGDTEVDIYAARELGVEVCALTCGLRNEKYLKSLSPDMLEANLKSFADKVFSGEFDCRN